jgi:hypothetical protein
MAMKQKTFPLILVIAGGFLLIVAVIIAMTSGQSPQTVSIPTAIPTSLPGSNPTEDPLTFIPRVSLADAKAAYDQKTAVFVDVRDAQSFASGHIANAMSIPLIDLPNRLSELKPGDWIITVCT